MTLFLPDLSSEDKKQSLWEGPNKNQSVDAECLGTPLLMVELTDALH